ELQVITACDALGVDDILLNKVITLYPNPTSNNLYITTTSDIVVNSIDVYDVSGKLIANYNENVGVINISHFSNGLYFISVNTDKGVYNQKIVKQ
ncbi:MAG: T9SS type A sorting domain-containing protein, partial [Flavobacteriaceae bacterium]|nr:T9SS type A sorting domain-containing protein [Flavobacteriaceae bacterium]